MNPSIKTNETLKEFDAFTEFVDRVIAVPHSSMIRQLTLQNFRAFEGPCSAVQDVYPGSTMIPIILRSVGNQFIHEVSFFRQ